MFSSWGFASWGLPSLWHHAAVCWSRPIRIALGLALVLSTLPLLKAQGHVVKFPRLVQIVVDPQRISVGMGVTRHAGAQAALLRARFDTSADGLLDRAEEDALAVWLDQRARRSLRLELDGEELHPEVVDRKLQLAREKGAQEGDAIRLSSVSVLALGMRPGVHRFRVEDRPENIRQLVPVRLDLPAGWALSDVIAEGEAMPLTPTGTSSWQGSFAGQGGSLEFSVTVPKQGAETIPLEARGAANSLRGVGSSRTGSEP